MRTLVALILLIFNQINSYSQTGFSIDRDLATKAAAYINKEKEVILYCTECKTPGPRKVVVNDAEVVMNHERYAVRLHGLTADTVVVNELVNIANVYVRKGLTGTSLGLVLGINCTNCGQTLNWKTMHPAEKTDDHLTKREKRITKLTNDLSGPLPTGSSAQFDSKEAKVEMISLSYDKVKNTIRIVLADHSGTRYVCNLETGHRIKAKGYGSDTLQYLNIRYRGDTKLRFWFTVFDGKGQIIDSGSSREIILPVPPNAESHRMARDLCKISGRK